MAKLGLHARYGPYALVTGAARGIGRAFATHLAADGFDLLLVDREAGDTIALAEELGADHGIDARALICDLAEPGLSAKAEEWATRYEIGLLVNNAGISLLDPFFDISLDAHLATLDLNCRATLVLTYILGKAMASRGSGGIIIVSSASGLSGSPYFCHYAATKGYGLNLACGLWSELRGSGVEALAVVWAKEFARYGIRAASIAPGFIATEMVEAMKPEAREKLTRNVPLGRTGDPDEIARTVQFIVENDYVSGRCIEVDGALRL